MIEKPQAVLWDWDDTLVDTWPVVRSAVNTALVAMGSAPWSEEEARKRLGPPARVLFTGLFGEERWQEADRIYIQGYLDSIAGHLRVHEGAEETLRFLENQGIPMGVVSAKRGQILRQESTYLGFDRYFTALVGAGDATADKPDPASVRMALAPSGIAPGPRVWFIGDSGTDLACAFNSSCTSVLLETKLPPESVLGAMPPAARYKGHADLLADLRRIMQ